MDIRERMYRQALLQRLAATLLYGLIFLAVLFFLNRVIRLPIGVWHMCWIVVSVAVIIGVCRSIKDRKDLSGVARIAEDKMHLSERLSTALGVIRTYPQSEFARLQIRDAAERVKTLDTREVSPYRLPKRLKFLPIPMLLIGISFTISPFYEIPKPLTEHQQQVLDRAVQNLEGTAVKNTRISENVKALKTASDIETAQEHLRALKKEVRTQQTEQSAITEVTETDESFSGMDAKQLADELKQIADDIEMPPELQAELARLFERLAAELPKGALSDSLQKIQGKAVTPETLEEIIARLEEIEALPDLAALEAQLTTSQKDLALATLEVAAPEGGIANSDGAPGQNAGTREVQGTRETTTDLASETAGSEKIGTESEEGASTQALMGDRTPEGETVGTPLTLVTGTSGTGEEVSRVFTGEMNTDAPAYLPFSEVVLSASRSYAAAVENNRIPVRYQPQIKSYLEAVRKKNEEKRH